MIGHLKLCLAIIALVGTVWLAVRSTLHISRSSPQVSWECLSTDPTASGDALASARLVCNLGPPCGGLAAIPGVEIQNSNSRWIEVTVGVQSMDANGHIENEASIIRPVAPRQTSGLIGCAARVSYVDINNPKAWILQYSIKNAHSIEDPTSPARPSDTCFNRPAVSVCLTSVGPVAYQLQAKAQFRGLRQNGVWVVRRGPVCIEEAGNTIKQAQCNSSTAQQFVVGPSDLGGCSPLRSVSSRLLVFPRTVTDSDSEFFLWRDSDFVQRACQSVTESSRWRLIPREGGYFQIQNKQTGACIDAHAPEGVNRPGEKMHTLGCRDTEQQLWKLQPVTRFPGLSFSQNRFLQRRRVVQEGFDRPPNVPGRPSPIP